jgi:3-oxoadipate enol-lactonase
VLGESFGAMTALHLAALAPERINRLALCAGSSGGQGGRSYPIHEFKTLPDASARARAALTILDSRFVDFTAQKANELIDARMAQDAAFLANHSNRLNHDRLLAARADHDAWDALPIIDVPTLVFGGRYDQQSPPDRASTIASRLPNSTLRWIEGGHSICFGSEDTVEQILGAWT